MKKWILILVFMAGEFTRVMGQSPEAKQLLLNWEKLEQLKTILQQMKQGWTVINKGYTRIREISAGNLKLHQAFLDALMEVSPAVKQYAKIGEILRMEASIVQQGKAALWDFKSDRAFTPDELTLLGRVYSNLFTAGVRALDELLLVITAGRLRMSDEERLAVIDRVYEKVQEQFSFLQDFSSSTAYLSLQRKTEQAEISLSKRIYGLSR